MIWEGGARQVWCKKADVVGGFAVIRVQHQLLREVWGLQGTEEVTMEIEPLSKQSVGKGSSRMKVGRNRAKRNVSAKQTILVNNKFLRKICLCLSPYFSLC